MSVTAPPAIVEKEKLDLADREIRPPRKPAERQDSLPIISLWHSNEHALPVDDAEEVHEDAGEEIKRQISVKQPYSAFSKRSRRWIVFLAAAGSFWSPITANVFFPAIPDIARDLGVSVTAVNLSVTLYLIAQGISPTLWGAVGDTLGRRPTYITCLLIYIACSLGLGFTHSYGILVFLRFFQACGSASVIALGAGSVGDVSSPAERGVFFGWYSLSTQSGPALGPVIGGVIADTLGWNWIFLILAIACGVVVAALVLFQPETLRSIVGNGSRRPPAINRPLIPILACKYADSDEEHEPVVPLRTRLLKVRPLDPLRILLFEKDILCALLFVGIGYASYTGTVVSLAILLQTNYGLNTLQIGLSFLANGVGCIAAGPITGYTLNRSFRHYARDYRGADGKPATSVKDIRDLSTFPIEKARLLALCVMIPMNLISTISFGWTIDRSVHLAAPLFFQFFIGFSMQSTYTMVNTLNVDLFPKASASITASNNLVRCLLGAAMTSAMQPLLNSIGAGFSFTLLTGILALSIPLPYLVWTRGFQWRKERKERLERRAQEVAARP